MSTIDVNKIAVTSKYDSLKNVYTAPQERFDVPSVILASTNNIYTIDVAIPRPEGSIVNVLLRSNGEGDDSTRWRNAIRSPNRFLVDTVEDDGYEPKIYTWFTMTATGVTIHHLVENFDTDDRHPVYAQWVDAKVSVFAAPSS